MPDNATLYAAKPQVISLDWLRAIAPGAVVAAKPNLFGSLSQFTVTSAHYVLTMNVMPVKDVPAHVAGFAGYIPQISQGHTEAEIADFTARVRGVRQVLGCVIELGWDAEDDCRRVLDAVARAMDAFLFLEGSIHVVLTGKKWLLPAVQHRQMEIALARKQRSEAILRREDVPYIEHLPIIETEATMRRRTVEEIAWRAMAVGLAAVKGEGLEQTRVLEVLARYQLEPHLTPAERRFLFEDKPSDLDRTNFTWKYECYGVLLWALGYTKDLGRPDHTCDVPPAVRVMVERTSPQFIAEAQRREQSELFDAADLAFRYHWAVTEARLQQTPPPAGLDPGVVYERHYALNWLIGYADDWDHVPTDT